MLRYVLVALVIFILDETILIRSSQIPSSTGTSTGTPRRKKDVTSYSEADLERLYDEWEKNDPDKDEDDDDEALKKKPKAVDLKGLDGKNPEEILKRTKKGETLMMFVNVRDPQVPSRKDRPYTNKMTELWRVMLLNNHIQSQVFLIDDDRAIFMFPDGSQAFEAKDFLLKQIEVTEITLEGQQYFGAGAANKEEL
uniref:Mesoderm development candidate 2 domain containing protein n=1 Tax=Haemonchus contortus TaxID=6289 RepID=A0A7I4Y1T7_HAECO|nr:Mesoderm development candidate 2 domain containing protein [Haemonchus contortus]